MIGQVFSPVFAGRHLAFVAKPAVKDLQIFKAAFRGDFLDGERRAGKEEACLGELVRQNILVRRGVQMRLEEFEKLGGADPAVPGQNGDRNFFRKVVMDVGKGQIERLGIVRSVGETVGGQGMTKQGAVGIQRQDVLVEFVGMIKAQTFGDEAVEVGFGIPEVYTADGAISVGDVKVENDGLVQGLAGSSPDGMFPGPVPEDGSLAESLFLSIHVEQHLAARDDLDKFQSIGDGVGYDYVRIPGHIIGDLDKAF